MSTHAQLSLESIETTMRLMAEERNPERLTSRCTALGAELESLRRQQSREWPRMVPLVRRLPGFSTLQQDPFTNHGYRRPRGYPGDADLLDFIYQNDAVDARRATEAGLAIFRATTAAAAPRAVRNRQATVARLIDNAALELGRPLRVASLGCGHLAEAQEMAALETGAIERFWALDQDQRSLDEVRRRFPHPAVAGVRATVRDVLRGHAGEVRDLDFFYAAGLFDYLHDRAARALVRRMFDRLRPGGTLLIANFLSGTPDRAYMEAVMDWWLVYRAEHEVWALDGEIDATRIADKRTFNEPANHVAFLALRRK